MKIRFIILFVLLACTLPVAMYGQKQYKRGVILELFTGQKCPSCSTSTPYLKEMVKGHEDDERLIWLSHHAGYFSDSLTIKASTQIAPFYSVYNAPSLVYNRSLFGVSLAKPTLVQSVPEFGKYNEFYRTQDPQGRSLLEIEMDKPADISVDMKVRYDKDSRNLTLTVYGEKNNNLAASAPALSVFFVQKKWIGMQSIGGVDYDFNYEHHNPVLHLLSDHYLGDLIEFDASGKYSKTFEYTVPQYFSNYGVNNPAGNVTHKFDPENTYIVAIVANRDETSVENPNYNRGNAYVLNAVKAPFTDYETSVSEVIAQNDKCNIYYSDGMVVVEGGCDDLSVYNLSGQMVENRGLDSGIYIVKAVRNGNVYSKKVMVP